MPFPEQPDEQCLSNQREVCLQWILRVTLIMEMHSENKSLEKVGATYFYRDTYTGLRGVSFLLSRWFRLKERLAPELICVDSLVGPSWKRDIHSTSQEITNLLWKSTFH